MNLKAVFQRATDTEQYTDCIGDEFSKITKTELQNCFDCSMTDLKYRNDNLHPIVR